MKKILWGCMWVCCGCLSIQAAMIQTGVAEIGMNGRAELNGADGATVQGDLRMGRFVVPGLLLGGSAGYLNSDRVHAFDLRGRLEFHWFQDGPLVPYAGVSVGLGSSRINDYGTENGLILGLAGGVKVFLAENVALNVELAVDQASSELYIDSDQVTDNNLLLTLGLRLYY